MTTDLRTDFALWGFSTLSPKKARAATGVRVTSAGRTVVRVRTARSIMLVVSGWLPLGMRRFQDSCI